VAQGQNSEKLANKMTDVVPENGLLKQETIAGEEQPVVVTPVQDTFESLSSVEDLKDENKVNALILDESKKRSDETFISDNTDNVEVDTVAEAEKSLLLLPANELDVNAAILEPIFEPAKELSRIISLESYEKEITHDILSDDVWKEIKEDLTASSTEESIVEDSEVRPDNQELIDSALDYWQLSNDFQEDGELENTIGALDKAYSLILKIDEEDEPEILQQKDDLRIAISRRIIDVYSSRYTFSNGTHRAIPLEMNEHVKKAIDLFKGRSRKYFLDSYVRSGKYRPAIVLALKEAGLPEELSWLPLIESGFKIRALSSARALGIWQFIASTGYKFGLKRDTWIDERMDPVKSTKAAVAYLTELHKIFGDWTTALAAYNCGEGRVLRNINSQKIGYLDNFWDFYTKLPSETAFYVPKFLAVLHIVNHPDAYGFELPPLDDELRVNAVTINKQVSLKTVAKTINISFKELKNLNPELRQGITPSPPYSIKIPEEKSELLLANIDKIPVYVPAVQQHVIYRVRKGDSLYMIAKRYKTTVRSIMRINRLRKRRYIKVGWKLKIPTHVDRRVAASSPSIGKGREMKYTVRKGDSPYLIAKQYNMRLLDFLTLNSLTSKSTIYPGQKLVVQKKRF